MAPSAKTPTWKTVTGQYSGIQRVSIPKQTNPHRITCTLRRARSYWRLTDESPLKPPVRARPATPPAIPTPPTIATTAVEESPPPAAAPPAVPDPADPAVLPAAPAAFLAV